MFVFPTDTKMLINNKATNYHTYMLCACIFKKNNEVISLLEGEFFYKKYVRVEMILSTFKIL